MSAELVDLTKLATTPDVVYVYNPNPEWKEQSVGGNQIRFCPRDETWPTRAENAKRGDDGAAALGPGVSPVRGQTWWEIHKGRKQIKAGGAAVWTAQTVLKFMLGDDLRSGPLGQAGLRPITGDPEKDQKIKEEAAVAASEKRYFDARNKVRAHEAAVAKATVAGTDPPGYTRDLDKAYRDKAEYERGGNRPVASHPCPVCNAPNYNEAELTEHMGAFHNQKPKAEVPAASGDAMVGLLAKFLETQEQVLARLSKLEDRKKPGRKPRKPAEPAQE